MMALVSVLGASTASAQTTDVSSSQNAQRESGDDAAQRVGADSERRLMIGGMSGVFTPTGIAGVTVEYTFARYVSVMGGGGVTLIANGERDFGWRFAAGLRGRFPFGRVFALSLSTWVSVGPFSDVVTSIDDNLEDSHFDIAAVLHMTPTLEFVTRGGLSINLFGGFATNLNTQVSNNDTCETCESQGRWRVFVPSFGISVGHSFQM